MKHASRDGVPRGVDHAVREGVKPARLGERHPNRSRLGLALMALGADREIHGLEINFERAHLRIGSAS
jgi:hypothetical protein